MALTEVQRETLRTKIVELLLEYRSQHLGTGASALTHWDVLQNRAVSAARRAGTIERWVSILARGLQLPAPNNSASSAIVDLATMVREFDADQVALDMIRTETGLLMALTRRCAEERRAQKGSV